MKSIKTADTYEGAYYLMNGAYVTDIKLRRIPPNKKRKKGHSVSCVFTMRSVQEGNILDWKSQTAIVNVRDFTYSRIKLKRMMEKAKRKQRRERLLY